MGAHGHVTPATSPPSRQQRCYGLQRVDLLNAADLGIGEGSIYPVLARLRAEKKVQTEWIDSEVGHAHKY